VTDIEGACTEGSFLPPIVDGIGSWLLEDQRSGCSVYCHDTDGLAVPHGFSDIEAVELNARVLGNSVRDLGGVEA
jgi:hypothetical protein